MDKKPDSKIEKFLYIVFMIIFVICIFLTQYIIEGEI